MERTFLLTSLVGSFFLSSFHLNAFPAWIGNQRAVVVLVEWANEPARVDKEKVEEVFFGKDQFSLRDYFQENAQGTFDITGRIINWKASSKTWRPSAGCNVRSIVDEGWRLFSTSIDIAEFDGDKNGRIDNFFVVHSGRIGSDRVGPDCMFTSHAKADSAIVFQSAGTGSIGNAIPIGFYVHEGGHQYFRLPDLYGQHYQGRYGIGMWGMMGLGAWGVTNEMPQEELFRYPAHFEPLSKIKIGWKQPKVINTTTRSVVIRPVETTNDIVAVPITSGTNYYLEYRTPRGFSTGHKGHGLLIWRNYKIIQADGRDDINNGTALGRRPLPPISENFGDDSDPFPGSLDVTEYRDTRYGVHFENITQWEDRIELDIVFDKHYKPVPYVMPVGPVYSGEEKL